MALSQMARAIIIQACETKQERKTGELAQHVEAAYAYKLKRMHGQKQADDVKAELSTIGFEW